MKKRILFHVIFLLSIHALGQTTLSSNSQTACAGTTVNVAANNANPLVTFVWTAPNQANVNGAQLNLNSVSQNITWTCTTYDATNNPVDTDVFTLTVNALPTVTASPNQTVCSGTNVTLTGSGASNYTWNNGITNGVAFVANATTTYTVTGTDANGCVNTAQTTVTVNALPTVTASPNQTVCSGTNVTLTGGGASSYTWNNGITNGVAFVANATTTYTVTGTAANGCVNSAQTTVTVNANPTINGPNNVCVGSLIQLTASPTPAATNAWTSSNAAIAAISNSGLVTAISPGTTTITYVNNNNCSVTAWITVNPLPAISGNNTLCVGSTTQLTGTFTPAANNAWSSSNPAVATITNTGIVSAIAAGSVVITYTNNLGCSASMSITVNPNPTITNSPLTQSICSGSTTTAVTWTSSIPGTTYNWTGTASASITGYTVSGTGNLGLMNTIQNSGNSNGNLTYTVTPTSNGCVGSPVTYFNHYNFICKFCCWRKFQLFPIKSWCYSCISNRFYRQWYRSNSWFCY
jgi:hypothetical protein